MRPRVDPDLGPKDAEEAKPQAPAFVDPNLQALLLTHKGKRIAFNAGRHRMTGRIATVDTQFHRVYIDVDSGLEPGIHFFIISRMSGVALLRD